MKGKLAIALLAATVPCLAFGQGTGSYQCSYGDLQRRVEILYEPGVTVPCEVHYYKDTEAPGERQVLWSATTQEGYCEAQTDAFIAKLRNWGWDCGQGAEAAPAPAEQAVEEAVEEAAEDAAAEPEPAAEE